MYIILLIWNTTLKLANMLLKCYCSHWEATSLVFIIVFFFFTIKRMFFVTSELFLYNSLAIYYFKSYNSTYLLTTSF